MSAWISTIGKQVPLWLSGVMIAAAVLLIGELLYRVGMRLLRHLRGIMPAKIGDQVIRRVATPSHFLLLLLAGNIAANNAMTPASWGAFLQPLFKLAVIGAAGWLIGSVVLALYDGAQQHYAWRSKRDNLLARRISTQLRVFRNTSMFFIVTLTVVAMAMTLPGLRMLGVSVFASAGVTGLVIGMAARPALANLIAGIQLALSQPIRLDDVVIIEGEWGRIDEITASYVVVLIWDQRRLIVPLSYFIEHPFQNWTHASSELMGTVFLYLDYTVPLAPLRAELKRIVEQSSLWDKRVCGLQVTDCKDKVIEVRALVSAEDAGTLWDLRCEVREKLIAFLQEHYPSGLPRLRAEFREAA